MDTPNLFPKMGYVREQLRAAKERAPLASLNPRLVKEPLLVLEYLRRYFHESKIAEIMHDVWVEQYYLDGYRYGFYSSKEKKTHSLLKPYSSLAESDKALEIQIGSIDVGSIYKMLIRLYSEAMINVPLFSAEQLLINIQRAEVAKFLSLLVLDEGFVMAATASLSRTYSQLKEENFFPCLQFPT